MSAEKREGRRAHARLYRGTAKKLGSRASQECSVRGDKGQCEVTSRVRETTKDRLFQEGGHRAGQRSGVGHRVPPQVEKRVTEEGTTEGRVSRRGKAEPESEMAEP
jgi:hypothetical protein